MSLRFQSGLRGIIMAEALFVMAGLQPTIRCGTVLGQMAGSSPAMTDRGSGDGG
jgi:hypothetical protein